jgi:hypothetical protein
MEKRVIKRKTYIWEAFWAHEVAHSRRLSDDGDSDAISLFDRLPDWKSRLSIRTVAGFAEKQEFVACRGLS